MSVGTSLPELATSVVAARKKNTDIAVGNIVGSNIFNIFFILGLTAVIEPVRFQAAAQVDMLLNLVLSLLLFALFSQVKAGGLKGGKGYYLFLYTLAICYI